MKLGTILVSCACLATAIVQAQTTPGISVGMDIACSVQDLCDTNWSKQGAGVAYQTQCPGFCYRIAVTNSGTDSLTNITVHDSLLGELTLFFNFPPLFSPGDFRTLYFKSIQCNDVTNIVTAAGQDASSSQLVMSQDTATVRLFRLEPVISCDKVLFTSPDDIDGDPANGVVTFPPDGDLHFLTNSVIICNRGNVDFVNVRISDPPMEVFRECSNLIHSISFDLAAGQCRTVLLCTLFVPECPAPQNAAVSVTAKVSLGTNSFCGAEALEGLMMTSTQDCSVSSICAGLSVARGLPAIVSPPPGSGLSGPQLQTPCGLLGGGAKWFKLSKDAYYPEGVADISTVGSSYDTILTVYSGPITNLTLLACNDDMGPSNKQSRVSFRFPPPRSGAGPYWLVVDGKGTTNGTLELVLGYEPTFETFKFNSNNSFELQSSNGPPLSYQLQASTGLDSSSLGWSTLWVTNLTTNFPNLRFTDTNAARVGQRYYRIAPAPP